MRLRAFPTESNLGGRFGQSAGYVPGATPSFSVPLGSRVLSEGLARFLKPVDRTRAFRADSLTR